ncbi:hypothetical protein GO013_15560 [Pseudodesulfovibrio sp. JC047]|uniref:hypothetical protein n=1 Tax=Pseudodesulfovibrio sp. JC047 TaxID=2683199 RepID=UPI0013D2F173|nr:hypothetical protein [Pseudodesulfovibrio sp. JC047]NDV20827.1 hypothetical protein [Pseudodesulfovibrio sp. JC047]
MAHVRTQVRDALKDRLSGLPTTSGNVFKSRGYPITSEKFPALLIYNGPEASEPVDFDDAKDREFDVIVEAGAFAPEDQVDDMLDQIAVEVENAIEADQTLGGLAKSTTLTGSEPDVSIDGEMPFGVLALTFTVNYMTEADPEQSM